MTDNLTICKHCGSDACYVTENSPTIKTYSCFGCGFTTNSLMKEGEEFYEWRMDMHSIQAFEMKDFMEALSFIGVLPE